MDDITHEDDVNKQELIEAKKEIRNNANNAKEELNDNAKKAEEILLNNIQYSEQVEEKNKPEVNKSETALDYFVMFLVLSFGSYFSAKLFASILGLQI